MGEQGNIVVGIDIGSRNIRAMMAHAPTADRPIPRIIATSSVSSEGMKNGYVINTNEVGSSIARALHQLEKTSGIPVSGVYVTLGSASLQSVAVTADIAITARDGMVTEKNTAAAMQECEQIFYESTRNRKIIHIFPRGWELDGTTVLGNPVGMQGRKLSVTCTVVHCLEHHYRDLIHAVTDAKVTILDVITTPIAESLPTLSKQSRTAGCALVNIGSETVSISTYEQNTLISLAVFPIGSMHITHDIAIGFQVPIDQAESIKDGSYVGTLSKKKLGDIIQARIEDIFELVYNHLQSIRRNVLLPGGIMITGGGGMLSGIDLLAKNLLQLPVSIPDMTQIIKGYKKELDQSWLPVYGLCHLPASDMPVAPANIKKFAKETKSLFGKILEQFIP